MATELEVVREKERCRITGVSRVTWWRAERAGLAPKRVQISQAGVGWLRSELEQWLQQRMAARGNPAAAETEVRP